MFGNALKAMIFALATACAFSYHHHDHDDCCGSDRCGWTEITLQQHRDDSNAAANVVHNYQVLEQTESADVLYVPSDTTLIAAGKTWTYTGNEHFAVIMGERSRIMGGQFNVVASRNGIRMNDQTEMAGVSVIGDRFETNSVVKTYGDAVLRHCQFLGGKNYAVDVQKGECLIEFPVFLDYNHHGVSSSEKAESVIVRYFRFAGSDSEDGSAFRNACRNLVAEHGVVSGAALLKQTGPEASSVFTNVTSRTTRRTPSITCGGKSTTFLNCDIQGGVWAHAGDVKFIETKFDGETGIIYLRDKLVSMLFDRADFGDRAEWALQNHKTKTTDIEVVIKDSRNIPTQIFRREWPDVNYKLLGVNHFADGTVKVEIPGIGLPLTNDSSAMAASGQPLQSVMVKQWSFGPSFDPETIQQFAESRGLNVKAIEPHPGYPGDWLMHYTDD